MTATQAPVTPEVQKAMQQATVTGPDGTPQVFIFDRPVHRHVVVERPVFVEVPPGTLGSQGMGRGGYGAYGPGGACGGVGGVGGGAYGVGGYGAAGGCGGAAGGNGFQAGGGAYGTNFGCSSGGFGGMGAGGLGGAGFGGTGLGGAGLGGAGLGGAGLGGAGLGGTGLGGAGPGGAGGAGAGGDAAAGAGGAGGGGLGVKIPPKKTTLNKLPQKPGGGLMSTQHYLDQLNNKSKSHGGVAVSPVYPYHDPAFGAGWRLRQQNKDPLDVELQQTEPDEAPPLAQLLEFSYKQRKHEDAATRLQRMALGSGASAMSAAVAASGDVMNMGLEGAARAASGDFPTIGLPDIQDGGMGALFSVFDGQSSTEQEHQVSRYGARRDAQGGSIYGGGGVGIGGPGGHGYVIPGQENPYEHIEGGVPARHGEAVPYGFGDRVDGLAGAGGGPAGRRNFASMYKPVKTPYGFMEVENAHPAWVNVEPEAGIRGLAWWLA